MFQRSIDPGKLPSGWLSASSNIHLPSVKNDVNYRPVSLTCISCKILEHIICKHIVDHLILNQLNHGFRSGYSCETQLIMTVHDLFDKFDSGSQIDMIVFDLSRAFFTILHVHGKLLHKMQLYGVDGKVNSWLRDFLTNRKMKEVVDGEEL